MKSLYVVIMICLFVSCGRKARRQLTEDNNITEIVRPLIDSTLKSGIMEIVELTHKRAEYRSPSFDKSCLIMEFDVAPEMKQMFFSDSTVSINHKVCNRIYPLDAYKGILPVNGVNVAVFDEYDIGDRYYNSDSLKMIPFDKFACYSLEIINTLTYYIRNSNLNYWNP